MTQVTRPTMSNDTGVGTDGTIVNKDLFDDVFDQVDDQCHSTTNTAQKPKATTDEVIAARGNAVSLDARLSNVIDDDGNLIDTGVQVADLGGIVGRDNWVHNDDMRIWCAGGSAAPTGWTLAGGGASVARDTTAGTPVMVLAAAVTRAGADTTLTQTLLATTANALWVQGKSIAIGCFVRATVASRARIQVSDGVTTSVSSYHTGGSSWEWLSVTHPISGSASSLSVRCEVNTGNTTAYFTGFSAVVTDTDDITLNTYVPCKTIERVFQYIEPGNATAATAKCIIIPLRMGFVRDVAISQNGDADGSALTVDVNTWDGAAFTTMFGSGKPTIADNAGDLTFGSSQPDTFARQGYRGSVGGTYQTGGAISIDFDSVGSGTPATNVAVTIHATEYARPQERFAAYNDGI